MARNKILDDALAFVRDQTVAAASADATEDLFDVILRRLDALIPESRQEAFVEAVGDRAEMVGGNRRWTPGEGTG